MVFNPQFFLEQVNNGPNVYDLISGLQIEIFQRMLEIWISILSFYFSSVANIYCYFSAKQKNTFIILLCITKKTNNINIYSLSIFLFKKNDSLFTGFHLFNYRKLWCSIDVHSII